MRFLLSALLGALLAAGLTAPAWAQGAATDPFAKFEIKDGQIDKSLTGTTGDVQKGRQVIISRTLGNCLACHEITNLKSEPYHGNTAPSLDGVASRMSEGELRLRIVDGTKVNPDTMMPPFYRKDGLNKVMRRFQNTTILSAQQVEDVVAYLKTLR
jgi:L-cysteine S-thiosulfotransferase